MLDEAMRRLLDYDRRRYWLVNGWSIRIRVTEIEASAGRPQGIKYAFTLLDVDGTRLLGFDNAHGIARAQVYDHRHRFRRPAEFVAYEFRGANELICDFFAAVEQACQQEGVAFELEAEEVELEMEATMTRKSLTELREEMRAVARGERRAAPLPAAPLLAALSREALELLSVLLRKHPASVTELVALTGRAQPNISRSLQLLERHRLIRLVREGREVRPEPIAKSVRVDLATGTYETTPASGAAG